MSRKRKVYSAAFKRKLVLEVLTNEKSLSDIVSAHNITPKNLQNWKKTFLDNAEIFNTEQRSQYTCNIYTQRLRNKGITISMDGKGRTAIQQTPTTTKPSTIADFLVAVVR